MATVLYNSRPSLQPNRVLSAMLAGMLRDPQPAAAQSAPAFTPATDILETALGFELRLALPGVKKDAVNIELLDGQLVISGDRPTPAATDVPASEGSTAPIFHRTETRYGAFARRFRLPEAVNTKAIVTELTDSVLRLTLPFDTEKVTKQHIAIR